MSTTDIADSNPPITLDKKRAVSAPFAVWMSILAMAVLCGIAWANLQAQVNSIAPLAMKVDLQSQALGKVEVMANDIQWIKAELQRQRREDSNHRNP